MRQFKLLQVVTLAAVLACFGCDSSSPNGGGSYVATDTTAGDVALTPGSLTSCIASSQCAVDACKDSWNTTCGAACANATASAAAPTAAALLECTTQQCVLGDCAGTNPPTQACMDDCTAKKCTSQLFACWEQGQTPGSGGCGAITACLPGCDSDPKRFTCQAGCYAAANSDGQSQFKATSLCLAQNPGKEGACAKDSLTCIADGKSGSSTCYEIQGCFAKCAESDTACQGACYGKGSSAAQDQLVSLVGCVSGGDPSNCMNETVACATPSGSAGCMDTAQCVGACPSGDAQAGCAIDCLHNATQKGAQAFAKLAPCIQKNCPGCQGSDCQSCATSKCFSEALSCSTN